MDGGKGMVDDEIIFTSIAMMVFSAVINAIAFALGWFVYGSIEGGLIIILLCAIYGTLTVLAIIPIIGLFAQLYAILFIAWPAISGSAMIEASWLTTLIFVIYMLSGLVITATTTSRFLKE